MDGVEEGEVLSGTGSPIRQCVESRDDAGDAVTIAAAATVNVHGPSHTKTRILPRCASLTDFDILDKVGEGTFG